MPDHTETRTLDEMGRMVTTSGDDYGMNLVEAVRMWPTPTSRDHKDTGDYRETREGRNSCNSLLGLAVGPTKTNGSLAPEFVEYLMGFPIGYTALEPSETR
jgi:hypothetical protein